jgi:hypothetical protein
MTTAVAELPAPAPAASPAPTPAPATPDPAPASPAVPATPAAAPEPQTLLGAAKDPNAVKGAPEKYIDFKLPEGFQADKPLLEKFSTTARELGLSQENAQKLVDLQTEHAKAGMESLVKEAQRRDLEVREQWKSETLKVLGADADKQLAFAAKALDRFGTPQTRQFLEQTGLGNHPSLVQLLITAGKAISEDAFIAGKPANGISDDKAALIKTFPTMFDKDGNPKY